MRWRGQKNLSPKDLRLAVVELCSAEYLATWGYEFKDASGLRLRREMAAMAEEIQTETEARQIADGVNTIAQRALAWLARTQRLEFKGGKGGAAAAQVRFLLEKLGEPENQRGSLEEVIWLSDKQNPLFTSYKRHNFAPTQSNLSRYAMTQVIEDALATTINRQMAAREMAVASCLLGIPWEGEAEPSRTGPRSKNTPADFIQGEADKIAKIIRNQSTEATW